MTQPEATQPTWTIDQVALLGDTRLTADSRVAGLILSHAGPEGLAYGDLEELLPDLSRDRLRQAIQKLERFRLVARKVGGRGHPDRFAYIGSDESGTYDPVRLGFAATLSDRWAATGYVYPYTFPAAGHLSAPTSSSTDPPLPPPLDARAREFIESSEPLVGCRGSLRDYLTERVEVDRHLAYAQSVAGLIQGTDEQAWMARDGTHHREGRAAIVAGALNELRQADEIGRYFPGPPGDVANLRSKVRYKVKSLTDAKRDATRQRSNGPAEAPRGEPRGGGPRTPSERVDVVR